MKDSIPDEWIDDILTAAFEGGITNWATRVTVEGEWPEGKSRYGDGLYMSEVLTHGGSVRVYIYDYEPESVVLTRAMMVKGIKAAALSYGLTVHRFHEEHDAGYGSDAVQYALFGEQVFC